MCTCLPRILVCRLDKKWTAHHCSQNCTLFIECFVFSIGCSVLWIQIRTCSHILYIVLHCVRANIDIIFLNVHALCIYIYVLCKKMHIQEHEHFTTSSKPSSFCNACIHLNNYKIWNVIINCIVYIHIYVVLVHSNNKEIRDGQQRSNVKEQIIQFSHSSVYIMYSNTSIHCSTYIFTIFITKRKQLKLLKNYY